MADQRKIFATNLQKYMSLCRKHQTDMARDLKISKATVSAWYNGSRYPRSDTLDVIAKYLGVSVADLTAEPEYTSKKKGILIPVYGNVAAGIPLEMIEDIIDYEEIDELTASSGEFFGLRIKGDSMAPRIESGDVVIVRKQPDAETGQIVIATVNGDAATCKRLHKYKKGIELEPLNPLYQPIFFSNEEIDEKPVVILGRVVELRGKL